MPGFTQIDISTPWALVGLFFVSLMVGLVIPRWMHTQRIQDYKEQNQLLRESLKKRDEQFDKALENNQLVVQALESIKREAAKSS